MIADESVFSVRDLSVGFVSKGSTITAVDRLSYSVSRGKTLGIVGESGSGKSVGALSTMRLLPRNARILSGDVRLLGESLIAKSEREMRAIRGARIAMIFQDPMTSLNPVLTVGEQIAEVVRLHRKASKEEAWKRAIDMLRMVHIPDAVRRVHDYPHLFSGGMRQRVMIAMALSCDPDVLIADEPTTALDVTIQAQIIELMKEVQERMGMAIVVITHDLGVVAEMCDDVLVMYGGSMVEYGSSEMIFTRAAMPYTRGLLASLPRIDSDVTQRLVTIEGQPPSLAALPTGCVFAPRCPQAFEACSERPPLFDVDAHHRSRCWLSAP
jgi:oligopeptide/dipeptide ABC transporter ATP-binding protein